MDIARAVGCTNLGPRVLLVGAVVAAGPAAARADAPSSVSVPKLLGDPAQLAQRLHDIDPLVGAARARVGAALAQSQQARVLPNPELQAGLGGITLGRGNNYGGMMGPTSLGSTGNVSLGIGELIEIGKRGPRRNAADLRVNEASQEAIAALGGRIADGTELLGKLAYLTARRDVVSTNLEDAKKLLALEKTRVDHQDLAPVDFERLALDTTNVELLLRRAETELAGAVAECSAFLQGTCSTEGLDAQDLDQAAALPATLPEAATAIVARPAHAATRAEMDALNWDARLAEHRRIPDPTIGLTYTYDTYQYSGSVPQSLAVSVGIPLPLFDTGTHDAQAARASAKALEAETAAEVHEASGAVSSLMSRRDTLMQILNKLETESVPASTKIIEQTRKSFDLGQSRLADLILVERSHRDLLLDVLDTRFELFEVRAQLRQQLGLDDEVARSLESK